jgi:hypothetical protein
MKKYFGVILVLVVTVIFLSGCFYDLVIPESDLYLEDTENGSSSPTQEDGVVPGKGTLKIYLTDALEKNGAYDTYDAIEISISRIEAHFVETDKEQQDIEDASKSKKGNWQPIVEWDGGYEVDLIALKGKSILLASLEQLPSRKYTQLRIFLVEDQAIIVVDGEDYPLPLNIPSVGQTGIKLIHPFEIIPGQITELILDFDAQKSIIKTGNDEYKLKPVIGIISNYYDQVGGESYLGSIAGLVYGLNGTGGNVVIVGASVKIEGLILPFLETTTTGTGEDGYTINDIPFGVYTVTASYEGYTDAFEPVSIDSDEVITVNFWLEQK